MTDNNFIIKWTLHHTWVICICYIISMITLLFVHGAFGYNMNDNGSYLSNALMHIVSGAVLGFGTGLLQRELLKKYFHVPFIWVWSLVIGFVMAESIAGIVLWKMGIYRGLINVLNTYNHLPEALIFALAGLISGMLQSSFLKHHFRNRFYWILANMLGWGILILSTSAGLFAFIPGAIIYGVLTGIVFVKLMQPINPS